jgi:hypothetical protein
VTEDHDRPVEMPLVPSAGRASLKSVRLAIAIAAVLAATGLAVWTVRTVRNRDSHRSTRMRLLLVTTGLRGYSQIYGHLPHPVLRADAARTSTQPGPPNGTVRPLYGWRVQIVPFLVEWHGTWDPSRPWDDPANEQLAELSSFFAYDATGPKPFPHFFPEANILAITGPGTAFGDGKEPPMALKDVPPQTILVVETRASGIPWPAPGDFDIRTMPQTINAPDGKGISSRNAGGFHVIFADDWVWLLSDKVPFDTLRKFFTIAEAKKHDREKLLGPFALHRGP